jgi:hypothetical protein
MYTERLYGICLRKRDKIVEELEAPGILKLKEYYGRSFDELATYGWGSIIINLTEALCKVKPDFEIAQIKEKFGSLHYYIRNGNAECDRLIHESEVESCRTCEECGSKESVTTDAVNHWIHTLCSVCRGRKVEETEIENAVRAVRRNKDLPISKNKPVV